MASRSKNPMKSLNSQLRQKGLMMIAEPVLDPTLGAVYTFQSVKPGMSNSDVAYKLYYAGEVAKWSPTRRKAIDKAASRAKKQQEAGKRVKEESESAISSEKESAAGSGSD
ncbi:hypothetical protein H2200_006347 [Cladophialophora chaetospira]|uniref:Uncharacterized protein n=1 Tax=Cladophialophora chaetospira TaxID=386627 RepID=A0AA39CJA5_9EURO|nr:hypothetical protein H2200_006347 [Cladophialophora chaetospira]